MKRLVIVCVLLMSACVQDRKFHTEDGVCYRTSTDKIFWVVPVGKSEVQSVPANCGDQ